MPFAGGPFLADSQATNTGGRRAIFTASTGGYTIRSRLASSTLFVVIALLAASCAGGVSESDDLGEAVFGEDPSETFSGGGEAGPLTQTAEPGQAVVEVDGERIVYESTGSQFYTCKVTEDRVTVNYQTPEGHNFSIQASMQGDGWIGSISFNPAEGDTIVGYGAQIPVDGSLGLGDGAVSFEGTASRIEDFDFETQRDVSALIAVNCEPPGGNPTATVGENQFVFELSGASITCEVSDETVQVYINRQVDNLDLQIDLRTESQGLIGGVSIVDGEDNYYAVIFSGDGTDEGLVIDGSTISYEGTFVHTSSVDPDLDEELEGSATATC
jgi:hypothetical protein